jgi:hypothetical protein
MFRDRVRERDLDHFLIEELHSSIEFREWLLAKAAGCFDCPGDTQVRVERAARRSGDGRETDVRLSFAQGESVLAEILIENKVTDDFQEGQAESYAAEVSLRRNELGLRRVAAILIAPEARLRTLARKAEFDCVLSVESICATLERRIDAVPDGELRRRLMVKIELLDAIAGKRTASRWIPVAVPEKRDFAKRYEQLAGEVIPDLRIRPSDDGPKALTRFFERFPHQEAFPCKVRLKHEFGSRDPVKYANLQFDGRAEAFDRVAATKDIFPPDGSIFPICGGKSLMIRVATPGLVPDGDRFEEQREKVMEGLHAIRRLSEWLQKNGPRLRDLIGNSPRI